MLNESLSKVNSDISLFLQKNIQDDDIKRLSVIYRVDREAIRDIISRELIFKVLESYYLSRWGQSYFKALQRDFPDGLHLLDRFLCLCREKPQFGMFKDGYFALKEYETPSLVEIPVKAVSTNQPTSQLTIQTADQSVLEIKVIEKRVRRNKSEFQDLSDNNVLTKLQLFKKGLAKVKHQDVEKEITRFKDKPKNPEEKIVYFLQHPEKFQMNLKKANTFVNDTFNFSLFARGPVFNVMSSEERYRYTRIINCVEVDIDRPETEVYDWECGRFEISGPYLCTGDAKVLNALLFLHKRNFGLYLKTTGLKLAQTLGMKTLNKNGKHSLDGRTYYRLARHLGRLSSCYIEFQASPGHKHLGIFSGKVLDYSLSAEGLVVKFNNSLIIHTQRRLFSQLDMRFLNTLNAMDYRLVTFLESHEYGKGVNASFQRSLSFMKELFYPKTHNELDDYVFNGRIKNSIKRLKDAEYLHQDSGFENGQYIFGRLQRKPYLGEVNLQSISHLRLVPSGTLLVEDQQVGQVVNLGQKEENPHLGG